MVTDNDLDAIEARERAALAAARDALRGPYDLAGFDRLTREERRADDALRLVVALRESRAEVADYDALVMRQGRLLLATADALKGPPPPLSQHSAHDLPEVAARLRAQLAAQAPAVALDAIRNGRFVVVPAEDDTDAAQLAVLAAGERSPAWQSGEEFAEQHPEAAGRILG